MIIALLVLIVSLAFATVALVETLDSRSHTTRDTRSQRALQAADAGVDQGIYRFNQINLSNVNFTAGLLSGALANVADCVIPQTSLSGVITAFTVQAEANLATGACALPDGSGVSSPISDTVQVGNHAFYEMQQVGGATTVGPNVVLHPKVVAVGVEDNGNSSTCSSSRPTLATAPTSGCVVRRVMATLAPVDPFQLIEAAGNLTLNGAVIAVTGDMRTNGNLSIPGVCPVICLGLKAATITGTNLLNLSGLTANVTYGGGFSKADVFLPVLETFTPQASSVSRQAVSVDDTGCPSACVVPSLPSGVTATTLGGNNGGGGTRAYDPTTNTVTLTRNTMTLTPGDYILCNFNATGGSVTANITSSTSTPVRVFIDSPTSSRCSGNGLGSNQGNFNSTVGVSNLVGGVTSLTGSSQFQLYVVGNGTAHGTTVTIGGSLTESMFLYAPTSDVTISGLVFEGNAIGDNVTLNAATLLENVSLNNYSLANAVGVFHVSQYTECTPVYPLPEPDPTSGC